jgi:hypothetical protein
MRLTLTKVLGIQEEMKAQILVTNPVIKKDIFLYPL